MALGKNLGKQSVPQTGLKQASSVEDPNLASTGMPSSRSVKASTTPEERLSKVNEDISGDTGSSDKTLLVVFPMAGEEYAMSIELISEVVKMPPIAKIPQVPSYIKGVTNVRGNVCAVLDLHERLGVDIRGESASYAMVIRDDEMSMAVEVTKVPDTLMIARSEIDSSSNIVVHSAQDESYIKGVIRRDKRMIILLDVTEMIRKSEFEALI